jgi:type VI secretion system protein ImpN
MRRKISASSLSTLAASMNDEDFERVSACYRDLVEALGNDGVRPRPPAQARILTDLVRRALDLASEKFAYAPSELLCNSFWQDRTLYQSPAINVVRVLQRDLEQSYVMKTLASDCGDSPQARIRLLREAEIHTQIVHPSVIRLHTVLRLEDGRPALLLEEARESLLQFVSRERLTVVNLVNIILQLLEGLEAVHRAGFVHADVCPANILIAVNTDLTVKVADFSISIPKGTTHEALGYDRAFNYDYSAPEQQRGSTIGPSADLYSCGRVIERLADEVELSRTQKPRLAALIEQWTHDTPEKRPASCVRGAEMLHHLLLDF